MMRTLLKRPTTIFLRGVLGLATLLSLPEATYAQCPLDGIQYPSNPVASPTTIGDVAIFSDFSYAGEHGVSTGLQTIYKYTIDVTNLSDPYITVFDMDDNVIAFGPAPFLFIPPADGDYKFQWTTAPPDCGSDTDDHSTSIELTDWVVPPTCPQPVDLGIITATTSSAQVEWNAGGSETEWVVEYGPNGFTPGTGTYITAAVSPEDITGLASNGLYDVYVRSVCGPGDTSFYEGPVTFNTFGQAQFLDWDSECGPGFTDISTSGTNLNLTDDSEAGVTLPFAWLIKGQLVTEITVGNNGGIILNTLVGNAPYTPFEQGLYPYAQDMNTPAAGGGVFYHTTGTAGNRKFIIEWKDVPHYPSSGNSTFEFIYDEATTEFYYLYDDVMMDDEFYNYGADAVISAITPDGQEIMISEDNAEYLSANSCVHFLYTDCPRPTNLSSIYITAEEIALEWDAGLANETDWTVEYGPAGFTPGTGSTITVSDNSALIPGLAALTEYDFYIYAECSPTMTSNGLIGTFTTLPNCSDPTGASIDTGVDSVFASWTWTEGSPMFPVAGFNYQYGPLGYELYSGTTFTADGTNNADTFDISGWLPGGVYEFYIQAVCDNGPGFDTSSFIGPFQFVMPITNDDPCGVQSLATDGTVYIFNNEEATVATGENNIAPPPTGWQETDGWGNSSLDNTTWFTFIAPPSGNVRINNTGINYDGQIAVYHTFDCDDYNEYELIGANDDAIDGGFSTAPNFVVCGLVPGLPYHMMHDGHGSTGNYSISITEISVEAGTAQTVVDLCSGESVNLNTTVTGIGAGGNWSSDIPAVDLSIVGSTFYSEGLAYQVFDFEYRVTQGCAYDSVITQVHVFGPSNAGQDGIIEACRNEPVDLYSGLNGNADLGGTWYDPSDDEVNGSIVFTGQFPGSFNYDYIGGNGICPNDTASVVINVGTCDFLSVEEEVFSAVNIYPNPSDGLIYISSEGTVFDYTVLDAKGREIAAKSAGVNGAGTTAIDLSSVEAGVYFIRLASDQAQKLFRIVIR